MAVTTCRCVFLLIDVNLVTRCSSTIDDDQGIPFDVFEKLLANQNEFADDANAAAEQYDDDFNTDDEDDNAD